MTIEEMREKKRQLGYSYEQIAEIAGIPLGTVQKVLGGVTRSPRYETLQALEKVFTFRDSSDGEQAGMIREEGIYRVEKRNISKKQGEYTIEDYYAQPEEHRVELIDGVLYDLAAPKDIHQIISVRLLMQLNAYIEKNQGTCIPVCAPIDVQLDCDDRTMVQPDIAVVCDRTKFKGVIYGAPDLVIEILSVSTRKKDAYLKLMKYQNAGVREYWLVDPDKRKVVVYDLEHEDIPVIYGFEDIVQVRIFGEECKIDFVEISEYIGFLYEK